MKASRMTTKDASQKYAQWEHLLIPISDLKNAFGF